MNVSNCFKVCLFMHCIVLLEKLPSRPSSQQDIFARDPTLWLLVKSTSSTKHKVLLFLSLHPASCPLLYSNLYCSRAAGFHSTMEFRDASSSFSSSMCLSCESADDASERLAETFLILMLGSFLRSPLHSLLKQKRVKVRRIWHGFSVDGTLHG